MQNYKDMLLKAKYYREQVMQSFIKRGYYPSKDEIAVRLSDIDTRTALLDTYMSKKGSLFNTKEVNYMFECIYKDLNILYTVLQDILVNDYNKLKLNIEAYLTELEFKTSNFKKRMDEEMSTSSLGNTLFFESNSWNSSTKDNITTINLGDLTMVQSAEIAFFANINNVEATKVSFKCIAEDGTKTFRALPYNYNNDTYIVPGKSDYNIYELNLNGKLIVDGKISSVMKTDPCNDYKILAGSNKMFVTYKDDNSLHIEDIATNNNVFYAKEACYIEFYYVDGEKLEYNFNMRPNHTNFTLSDGYISTDGQMMRKIFIDAPAGFSCSFKQESDSVIFAQCTDGLIYDANSITYAGNLDLRDFQIREIVKSNTTDYKIQMFIDSDDPDILSKIDCVYIKEVE